ncbi:MAG: hypothetical protein ABI559_04435 [Chloroflexota bacterium]
MDTYSLGGMLTRDRSEWAALTAILDSRPADSMHSARDPDWNARDVYNHFARWIDHSTNDFEAMLTSGQGIPRPAGTDDEINARWRSEDANLSLDEARERAQRAFDRRVAVVQSVLPDRWNPMLDQIAVADGWEHIEAHRKYIESADARRRV